MIILLLLFLTFMFTLFAGENDYEDFFSILDKKLTYEYILQKSESMSALKILYRGDKNIKVLNLSDESSPKIEEYKFNSKGICYGGSFIEIGERVDKTEFEGIVKDTIEAESNGDFKIFDEKLLLYSDEDSVYIYAYVEDSDSNFVLGIFYNQFAKKIERIILFPKLIDKGCSKFYLHLKKLVTEFLKREKKVEKIKN